MSHFDRKRCTGCDNELISIGGKWYQQHIDANCDVIKLELNYDDTEMYVTNNDQDMKIESFELSISTENIPAEYEPVLENDPFAEIMAPESNAFNDDMLESLDISKGDSQTSPFQRTVCSKSADIAKEQLKRITLAYRANTTASNSGGSSAAGARQHISSRPTANSYQCRICLMLFRSRYRQRVHMRKAHPSIAIKTGRPRIIRPGDTSCAKQNRRLRRLKRLQRMKKEDQCDFAESAQTGPSKTTANEPNAETTSAGTSREHNFRLEDVKIWACGLCSAKAKVAANIHQHIRIVHGSSDEALAKPILDAKGAIRPPQPQKLPSDGVRLWTCTACPTMATVASNMLKHIQIKHGTDDTTLAKPVHDKDEAERIQSAQFGHRLRESARLWSCGLCSATAKITSNIYKHIRKVHQTDDKALARPIFDAKEMEAIRLSQLQQGVKLWSCGLCPATANIASNMLKHIEIKHGIADESLAKPIEDHDEAEAIVAAQLGQGRREDVRLWSCGLCTQTATQAANMYKHIRTAHGTDDKALARPIIDADEAEAVLAARSQEQSQLHSVDVKLWSCELCSATATTASNLYKHIRDAHGTDDKTLARPVLDEAEVKAIRSSQPHKFFGSDVKLWTCSLCSTLATVASNMYKHIQIIHGTDDKQLAKPIYDLDEAEAIQSAQLGGGRRVDVNLWACGLCPQTATLTSNLYKHIRAMHDTDDKALARPIIEALRTAQTPEFQNADVKLWLCKLCSATGTNSSNIYKHIRTVHGTDDRTMARRIFDEDEAEAIRSTQSPVSREKAKMWSCSLCPVTAKVSSNIYKHIRTVHGTDDKELARPIHDDAEIEAILAAQTAKSNSPQVRLWACTLCPATAKISSNLHKHIRTVHGVDDKSLARPVLDADEAEAILAAKPKPQTHSFRVADVKLWSCSMCPTTANTASNIYKHIRSVHGTDDKMLAIPIHDVEEFNAQRAQQNS